MPISNIYQSEDSLGLSGLKDTIYGIEHEELIPIRQTEVVSTQEVSIQKLYDPSPLNVGVQSWQVVLLLTAVLLVGVVKAFSNNRYRLGLKALFNYSVAQEIIREEQVFFHRSNIFLTIAHALTLSLFLYQLKELLLSKKGDVSGFSGFLIILSAVFVLYMLKYILSKILLFIFNNTSASTEYTFNISLYNNLLGVLLIPILCISYFTIFPFYELVFYIVIPVAILVFVLRLIRLFTIGKSIGLLYVYIFLYICTLEILPLVVLFRIFIHK